MGNSNRVNNRPTSINILFLVLVFHSLACRVFSFLPLIIPNIHPQTLRTRALLESHQQQQWNYNKLYTGTTHCSKNYRINRLSMTPPSNSHMDDDNNEPFDQGSTDESQTLTTKSPTPSMLQRNRRKMSLMWCDRDKCKDVVRERLGKYNQIVLNGPATGQVAYRWTKEKHDPTTLSPLRRSKKFKTTHAGATLTKEAPIIQSTEESDLPVRASLLFLVKPDDELIAQAALIVPQLTQAGIQVLLVPDLAAKLQYKYQVDTTMIELFEPPPNSNMMLRYNRRVDDDEDKFIADYENSKTPFPDLLVTLGGDGLLIHASMLFQGPIPPMLSIAGGSLGFLTSFELEETVEAVKIALGLASPKKGNTTATNADDDDLEVFPPNMPTYPYHPLARYSKNYQQQQHASLATFGMDGIVCMTVRMRLDCRVVNPAGMVTARYNVLNEVVIDRGGSPYLASLECFCDDDHLTTVQADGVIFATPTGSTAYSLSAGGSVVHPAVPGILVTPVSPHVLSFRGMMFPDHVILRCYVPEDARSPASVAFDGKHRQTLERGYSVQIKMSAYPVPTINRGDHSSDWLESLKRSFNFNTRPRQRPL